MNEQNKPLTAAGLPLPDAFVARMREMLGKDYAAFLASYARPVKPSLRINTLKASPAAAAEMAGYLGDAVAWQETGFYYGETVIDGTVRPGKHSLHEAGLYYIQEASAMLPASLRRPQPGERVLDLCAAPGGKATQLAATLAGEGLLVANEIHPTRAGILSQNIERMGIRNALVTNASSDELAERFPAFFHQIVVDAPCSGEGMFRKEADAITMWSPDNVALCAARQGKILDNAARMLSPDGYLVYSTCTFAPDENEGAVLAFLRRHPDFEVVASDEPRVVAAREAGLLDGGCAAWVGHMTPTDEECHALSLTYRVLPHHAEGEGHFAALLHKCGTGNDADNPHERTTRPRRDRHAGKAAGLSEDAAMKLFADFAHDVYGGLPLWVESSVPCLFGDRLYAVPTALVGAEATADAVREKLRRLRILRAGVCLGTIITGAGRARFEPDHALAMATHVDDGARSFAADEASAAETYLSGDTLPAADARGWHIVTHCSLPLGWGKASGGMMKNHYPKGLRRNG